LSFITYVTDLYVKHGFLVQVLSELEVEYETVPGWNQSIAKCREFEDLPPQAQAYVRRIEELVGVPIRWIGVGDGRLDIVDRGPEFTLRTDSHWN